MSAKQLGEMTREKIVRYCGISMDFNPIHIDDAFAKKAGLPGVIAHGPLTFLVALDALIGAGAVGQKGVVNARLKAPIQPGQSMELKLEDGGRYAVLAEGVEALSGVASSGS